MAYMLVQSVVENFDEWKESFDEYTELREEHGVRAHQIFRSTSDPNQLVVLEAKRDPMEERIDRTEITYLELIERQSAETPKT